jgi:hypothetical protein
MHKISKVISGGQTGVDQLGLEVAQELGIPTGGTAPRHFRTETGPEDRLRAFGLTEHTSWHYAARTKANVVQSDGTVLFGDVTQTGTQKTLLLCQKKNKPCLINPTDGELRDWLVINNVNVLNVAGNRGSQLSDEQLTQYRQVLRDGLKG